MEDRPDQCNFSSSRDRLVVRSLRSGRGNSGSNPVHGNAVRIKRIVTVGREIFLSNGRSLTCFRMGGGITVSEARAGHAWF